MGADPTNSAIEIKIRYQLCYYDLVLQGEPKIMILDSLFTGKLKGRCLQPSMNHVGLSPGSGPEPVTSTSVVLGLGLTINYCWSHAQDQARAGVRIWERFLVARMSPLYVKPDFTHFFLIPGSL